MILQNNNSLSSAVFNEMKTILVILLVLFVPKMIIAQSAPKPAWFWRHSPKYKDMYAQTPEQRLHRIKTGGILGVSAGAATMLGGIVMIANNPIPQNRTHRYDGENASVKRTIGGVLTGLGAGCMGGGIAMWLVSKSRLKKLNGHISLTGNATRLQLALKL